MEGKQFEEGSKELTHQNPSPPSQLASHQSLPQQQFQKGDMHGKHSEEEGQDAIQQLQAEAAGMPDLAWDAKEAEEHLPPGGFVYARDLRASKQIGRASCRERAYVLV